MPTGSASASEQAWTQSCCSIEHSGRWRQIAMADADGMAMQRRVALGSRESKAITSHMLCLMHAPRPQSLVYDAV